MSDDSLFATRNRLVVEGEQLVLHYASTGPLDLVSVADIRHSELTQPRKCTFLQRIAHSLENLPDGSQPSRRYGCHRGLT
jgi:hypothetical protein